MKMATSTQDVLKFHGNCKSNRIKGATLLTDEKTPVGTQVLLSMRGLLPEARHIKRYARRIKLARALKFSKVKVTEA